MNNINKILTALLLMVVFLQACKDKKNDVPAPTSTSNTISDFIKRNTTASQNFTVNVSNSDTTITGQKGTIVKIPKNAFVTLNGQPVNGGVKIELKEIFSKAEMVLSSIPTISDGKLLISGGEVYINATTVNGEPLKIDSMRTPTVQVPNNNNPQAGMTLFTGVQNGNTFNWKPVQVDTTSQTYNPKDSIRNYQHLPSFFQQDIYYVFTLQNFGWTNCDRFWNVPNVTSIKVDCQKFNSFANVYVVFKNLQCVMQLPLLPDGTLYISNSDGYTNMPVGEEITIIAVALENSKSYYTMKDLTITKDLSVALDLTEANEEDIVNTIKQKCN
jgi:hypothetical protein